MKLLLGVLLLLFALAAQVVRADFVLWSSSVGQGSFENYIFNTTILPDGSHGETVTVNQTGQQSGGSSQNICASDKYLFWSGAGCVGRMDLDGSNTKPCFFNYTGYAGVSWMAYDWKRDLVVFGYTGTPFGFEAETGKSVAQPDLSFAGAINGGIVINDTVAYISSDDSGTVVKVPWPNVNGGPGTVVFSTSFPRGIVASRTGRKLLFVGDQDYAQHVVDLSNGTSYRLHCADYTQDARFGTISRDGSVLYAAGDGVNGNQGILYKSDLVANGATMTYHRWLATPTQQFPSFCSACMYTPVLVETRHQVTPNGQGLNASLVTPSSGSTSGGYPVYVEGSGFSASVDYSCEFGYLNTTGKFLAPRIVECESVPPSPLAGNISVRVRGGGQVSKPVPFTYTN